MEPASALQAMPLPENLRPKQREVISLFNSQSQVIAKLPTGYGKSLAAAGAYANLRHQGKCNRMVYIVPRRTQAMQAANGIADDLRLFGCDTRSIVVGDDQIAAVKFHRRGSGEVFVATIQSLAVGATFSMLLEMMQTGRWFIVIDEHHHYGEDGIWASRVKQLNSCAMLAMSATPNRHDGTDFFPDPDVSETYIASAEAGIVKKLSLHAYEYAVDAVTIDGRVIPFTTEQLVSEAGSDKPDDIDRFMASRKMRWSPKYISPLVTFPMDRIIDLRTRNVRAQMLVQAMSCSHAQMVCEQIRALVPESMAVDWVGTGPLGRSDKDNEEAIRRFCPPKDPATGRRNWTLDILVNVGMAGEGLDTADVTEVVFLTPANITTSNLQIIGRGARVMAKPDTMSMPKCHVNVDTGSPMAEYVGAKVMALFDADVDVAKVDGDDDEPDQREYEPLPERMDVVVVDVRLTDIRSEPMFGGVYKLLREDSRHRDVDDITLAKHAEDAVRDYLNRGSNESSAIAQKRALIEAALNKVTSLLVRRASGAGLRVERTLVGDLRRRINSKKKALFGSVEAATSDELEKHYEWIRELEQQILTKHNLDGLPQWLR